MPPNTPRGRTASANWKTVERTFAWLMHWRRLVRDYETRVDVSIPSAIDGEISKRVCDNFCLHTGLHSPARLSLKDPKGSASP